MWRVLASSLVTSAALFLMGCLGFPAIDVRNSTYDQSPAGKHGWAVWSFEEQLVVRNTVQWFSERCPPGAIGETRDCAVQLGMTCDEGPEVDCVYAAQQTTRRRDRHGTPESRAWRTVKFQFSVRGTARGDRIQAASRREGAPASTLQR